MDKNTQIKEPQNQEEMDILTKEFLLNLVPAITGYHLDELEEESQEEVFEMCVGFFVDFIADYLKENYSKSDAIRFKTAFTAGEEVFEKFPDLEEKVFKAGEAFFDFLEENNQF